MASPLPEPRSRPHGGAPLARLLVLLAVGAAGMLAGPPAAGGEAPPAPEPAAHIAPFTASYDVSWRGITAGHSELELRHGADGQYEYSSRHIAGGLFRIVFPNAMSQDSRFVLDGGQVRPLAYRASDGSDDEAKTVNLQFDWKSMRVHGRSEGKPVDLALQPGTQDDMSVQIALMLDLRAGQVPPSFWLLNKDEVQEYQYTRDGEEHLVTPVGDFQAIIYRSQHAGSTRATRLWLAPELGYLPLRAEQTRKGKVEFAMRIQSYHRG